MAMNSLMSKIIKKIGKDDPKVSILSSSSFFDKDIVVHSSVPLINMMFSGEIDGPNAGIRPGLTVVVGDSRTFKTNFCLSIVKDYLDQNPDAICIFGDSEFGAKSSFESYGIDKDRVLHIALENIEDMKFKIAQALEEVGPGDKVILFIDSVSQIASKKEAENALNENAAADLTRARELNSFFRIITPKLMLKRIPALVINSYYDSIVSVYAEPTIKGGKQVFLSADSVFMVSRSQVKDGDQLAGWSFNYNCMKSRFVKEKSKFSVVVTYKGGIDVNSGLFDWAMESGFLRSEKQGFYLFNMDGFADGKSYRRKDIETNHQKFFDQLIKNDNFRQFLHQKYALEAGDMFQAENVEVDPDTGEVIPA